MGDTAYSSLGVGFSYDEVFEMCQEGPHTLAFKRRM